MTCVKCDHAQGSVICQVNQRRGQDTRAGGELRGLGILGRIVADALAAGHEDHPGGTDRHDELRVVEGARRQAQVTQIQRTPSYVFPFPSRDAIGDALRRVLPEKTAYAMTRRKRL